MHKGQLIIGLERKGFSKPILGAFAKVKREDFVPPHLKKEAYLDAAMPIGKGQTISQPYTIAVMLELLNTRKSMKILEIGSGCGYVLALLSKITGNKGRVYGIEIVKELYSKSLENLKQFKNIEVFNKNGKNGLKEKAPFDRILISAALPKIPKPLITQLKLNGLIVAPLGGAYGQDLILFKKSGNELKQVKDMPGFIFVPFVDK